MTIQEFTKEYERLCFGLRNKFNDGEALVYYDALKGYHQEQMNIACTGIIERYKFFPKPAEIIEEIHDIPPEKKTIEFQLKSGDRLPTEEERQEYIKIMQEGLAKIGNPV